MTDETEFTGDEQGKAGRGGNIPPVTSRFGAKNGNPINRKGRIGNFAQLRKLALKIGNEPLDVNSPDVTRFLALLRVMSSSRNPADRKLFLEYAVGKVKEELDVTSDGKALPSAIVQVYIPDNGRDKTDKTPA